MWCQSRAREARANHGRPDHAPLPDRQRLEEIEDVSVFLDLFQREKRSLRCEVIQALARSSSPEAAAALGEVLEQSTSYDELYWAAIGLNKSGTEASVAALEKHLYGKRDLRVTTLAAIARIRRGADSARYLDLLLDPKYRANWAVMSAIRKYADGRCVDAVRARLSKLLSRKGRRRTPEIGYAAEYLQRVAPDEPATLALFENLSRRWDSLWAFEQQDLIERVAPFSGRQVTGPRG